MAYSSNLLENLKAVAKLPDKNTTSYFIKVSDILKSPLLSSLIPRSSYIGQQVVAMEDLDDDVKIAVVEASLFSQDLAINQKDDLYNPNKYIPSKYVLYAILSEQVFSFLAKEYDPLVFMNFSPEHKTLIPIQFKSIFSQKEVDGNFYIAGNNPKQLTKADKLLFYEALYSLIGEIRSIYLQQKNKNRLPTYEITFDINKNTGSFNEIKELKEYIKIQIRNFILCSPGQILGDPYFGLALKKILHTKNIELAKETIMDNIRNFLNQFNSEFITVQLNNVTFTTQENTQFIQTVVFFSFNINNENFEITTTA